MYFRTFETIELETILLKNSINQKEFINQIFDPDFFQKFNLPNFSETYLAKSKNDFFGANIYDGPLSSQMAIVEVKLARKKLYRGTLNQFLGIDTLFPLVNAATNKASVNSKHGFVTIICVEELSGQVVNLFKVIEEFNSELFKLELSELKFGNHRISIITEFKYDESLFKKLKTDCVIRNQWCFVI